MVVALIGILLAQSSTGLFANDGVQFNGPLATWVTEETSDRLTQLHGTIFNVMLLLIWCHVVAAGFYLFVKGDNLIVPMFTGKKHRALVPVGAKIQFTPFYIAVILLGLAAGAVAWVLI